jgi:histidine triad (HIT) family protein
VSDCLFCKIAKGEIPAKIVYQDPDVFAFADIAPQAPTHILICPQKHMASLNDASPEDNALLGRILLVAKQLAADRKISDYRLVLNTGREAGQTVFHVHFHLLGGREFHWPPG